MPGATPFVSARMERSYPTPEPVVAIAHFFLQPMTQQGNATHPWHDSSRPISRAFLRAEPGPGPKIAAHGGNLQTRFAERRSRAREMGRGTHEDNAGPPLMPRQLRAVKGFIMGIIIRPEKLNGRRDQFPGLGQFLRRLSFNQHGGIPDATPAEHQDRAFAIAYQRDPGKEPVRGLVKLDPKITLGEGIEITAQDHDGVGRLDGMAGIEKERPLDPRHQPAMEGSGLLHAHGQRETQEQPTTSLPPPEAGCRANDKRRPPPSERISQQLHFADGPL